LIIIAGVVFYAAILPINVRAEEPAGTVAPAGTECKSVTCGADAGVFSKYVFRGVLATDGAVFQPDVWVSWKGATFTVWSNMDLTDKNGVEHKFSEVDYSLDYSGSVGKILYSAGAVYYAYPNTNFHNTSEVYGAVGVDTFLKPRLIAYYDYIEANGWYTALSAGHDVTLFEKGPVKASASVSASLGFGTKNYNRFYFGSDHGAFTDLQINTAIPFVVMERFTVKPSLTWSSRLDGTIRTKNVKNDNVVVGITLSVTM